jgi:hypothetical protein
MENLGRKIASRIIKPVVLQNISSITEIDLSNEATFLDARSIFLGGTTKFTLNRFRNNGTISENEYLKVHQGAFHHFKDACRSSLSAMK